MNIAAFERELIADGILAVQRGRLTMTPAQAGWTWDWPENSHGRLKRSAQETLEFRAKTQAVLDFLSESLDAALPAPAAARLGFAAVVLRTRRPFHQLVGERTVAVRPHDPPDFFVDGPQGREKPRRLREILNGLKRARKVVEARGLPPDGAAAFKTVLVLPVGELIWTGTAADEEAALAAAALSLLALLAFQRRTGPLGLTTVHRIVRDGVDMPPQDVQALHGHLARLLS